MKNLPDFSIDEIIQLPISPKERLSKFFPVGRTFRVGVITVLKLIKLSNGGVTTRSKEFEITLTMRAEDIGENGPRWLVFTEENGDQYGVAVEVMLHYHKHEIIELEPLPSGAKQDILALSS